MNVPASSEIPASGQAPPDTGPDLQALGRRLLAGWYWFALSLAVSLSGYYAYMRYTQPVFEVSAAVVLRTQGEDQQLLKNLIQSLGNNSSGAVNLSNEIQMLHTYSVAREAVDSCKLHASVFVKGTVRNTEMYKMGPLSVECDTVPEAFAGQPFEFEKAGPGSYVLYGADRTFAYDPARMGFFPDVAKTPPRLQFGLTYRLDGGNFRCTWDTHREHEFAPNSLVTIVFNNMTAQAEGFLARMTAAPLSDKGSSFVVISRGPIAQKEVDLVNQLLRNYIRHGLEEKNRQAENTIRFIDDQMTETARRLQKAEGELESFRTKNRVMDLSAASTSTFTKLDELEAEKARLQVRRKYYDYLLSYVRRGTGKTNELVSPSSMGIEDPLLQSLISRLSTLYGEKSAIGLYARRGNPALDNLEDRIGVARQELEENVRNIIRNSDITVGEIDRRISETERQVMRLPETERTLVNLQRRFNLNDNIFTYLMQKRAEAGMARAANTADAFVLEPASARHVHRVAPKPVSIFGLALAIGLLLPGLIIAGRELLNDRIRSRPELERLTRIPIAGVIGHAKSSGSLVVSRNLKSLITEAFRTVRLNLNYLAPGGQAQLIGITSSVSGEGKTFTALNLAAVTALAGKRTLLILADMRKPKFETDLEVDHLKGLSQLLVKAVSFEEAVQQTQIANFFVIPSGPVPPNPAELYGSPAMAELLERVRGSFDFIVVDTPPLGLVSDFLNIVAGMDVNLYLVRHNYTRRPFLDKINALHAEGKVPRLALVINDVQQVGSGYYGYGYDYGYGYGYGYGENYFDEARPRAWWQRLWPFGRRRA